MGEIGAQVPEFAILPPFLERLRILYNVFLYGVSTPQAHGACLCIHLVTPATDEDTTSIKIFKQQGANSL